MVKPAIDPVDFKSLEELLAQLPDMLADAPKKQGRLDLIVMRPEPNARVLPESFEVKVENGLSGDRWKNGDSYYALEDGSANPESQICMMMSGCIRAIAGDKKENWSAAGDNFFIDMDLTPANMPPSTRFAIGSAEFIVTQLNHDGCQKFIDRYGHDACLFVNTGEGNIHRLRGIYARVTQDGTVSLGDTVRKL